MPDIAWSCAALARSDRRGGRHRVHTRMRWFKARRRACGSRRRGRRRPELQHRGNPLGGDRGFGVVSRSARCRGPASPRTQSCRRAVGSTLIHHGMTTPCGVGFPHRRGRTGEQRGCGTIKPRCTSRRKPPRRVRRLRVVRPRPSAGPGGDRRRPARTRPGSGRGRRCVTGGCCASRPTPAWPVLHRRAPSRARGVG